MQSVGLVHTGPISCALVAACTVLRAIILWGHGNRERRSYCYPTLQMRRLRQRGGDLSKVSRMEEPGFEPRSLCLLGRTGVTGDPTHSQLRLGRRRGTEESQFAHL